MLNHINQSLFLFLHSFSGINSSLDMTFSLLAKGTGLAVIIAVFIIVCLRERGGQRIVQILFNIFVPVVIALVYSQILKHLFAAPRPDLVIGGLDTLLKHGGMDSFPSGHATIYSALAVSMFFYKKQFGFIFGVFALLIGVARVLSGVHWPIDIIGGFAIGFLISYAYHHFLGNKIHFLEKKKIS